MVANTHVAERRRHHREKVWQTPVISRDSLLQASSDPNITKMSKPTTNQRLLSIKQKISSLCCAEQESEALINDLEAWVKSGYSATLVAEQEVPPPRLVGVELNPGPHPFHFDNYVGPSWTEGKHVAVGDHLTFRAPALSHPDRYAKTHDRAYGKAWVEGRSQTSADREWLDAFARDDTELGFRDSALLNISSGVIGLKWLLGYETSPAQPVSQISAFKKKLMGVETNPGPTGGFPGAETELPIPSFPEPAHVPTRPTAPTPTAPPTTPTVPEGPYNIDYPGQLPSDFQRESDWFEYERRHPSWPHAGVVGYYDAVMNSNGAPLFVSAASPYYVGLDGNLYSGQWPYARSLGRARQTSNIWPTLPVVRDAVPVYPEPPPTLPLVGVEPNPGPDHARAKMVKHKKTKKKSVIVKKHVKRTIVKAHDKRRPPSLMDGVEVMKMPMRRESLGPIYMPATASGVASLFTTNTWVINPGIQASFPWLSQIAVNYEFYKFRRLLFQYVPLSTQMASTTSPTVGQVILATEYDVYDTTFTAVSQMENYSGSLSKPPCEGVTHEVNVVSRRLGGGPISERYVQTQAFPAGQDARLNEVGTFVLATNGMPGGTSGSPYQLGELFVWYEIDLIKAKSQTPLGSSLLGGHLAASGVVAGTAALGSVASQAITGNIGKLSATPTVLSWFGGGRFLITFVWSNLNAVTTVPAFGTFVNCNLVTVPSIFTSGTAADVICFDATTKCAAAVFMVDSSVGACSITVSGLTSVTSGSVDVFLSQVTGNLTATLPITDTQRLDALTNQVKQLLASRDTCDSPILISKPVV